MNNLLERYLIDKDTQNHLESGQINEAIQSYSKSRGMLVEKAKQVIEYVASELNKDNSPTESENTIERNIEIPEFQGNDNSEKKDLVKSDSIFSKKPVNIEQLNSVFPDWDIDPPAQFINPRIK